MITGALLGDLVMLTGWGAITVINLFMLHARGQTIGKMTTGVRIVRADGSKAGLGRILALRSFPLLVLIAISSPLGQILAFANIAFIFREDRRCIHDLLANTKVVIASTGLGKLRPEPAHLVQSEPIHPR
jgi:uncharacterized RDD family membrane protein YckC